MQLVLFDRDGTLLVDPQDERVDSVEKIQFFPDTLDALRLLSEHDIAIVIITNQAGIAEGRMTEQKFWDIHQVVLERLRPSGIKILKTYLNGEAMGAVSKWRKPAPGMLLQAAKDFNLNLTDSYMVGDRRSDVQAGINAGTKTILVMTGSAGGETPESTFTAPNLMAAAEYLVAHYTTDKKQG